jgi:hypothetical protein
MSLYLRTHDTQKRQISITPAGFEHTIVATARPTAVAGISPKGIGIIIKIV